MTRIGLLLVFLGLSTALASANAAEQYPAHKAPATGYADIAGQLEVAPPLNIAGPFPYQLRKIRQGDVVLVQIRYPVVPPMPASVAISTEGKRIELVGLARTSAEVALLAREPRQGGGFGVGFVQLVLRAVKPGTEHVTAHVKLADGSVKDVPLAFEIEASDK